MKAKNIADFLRTALADGQLSVKEKNKFKTMFQYAQVSLEEEKIIKDAVFENSVNSSPLHLKDVNDFIDELFRGLYVQYIETLKNSALNTIKQKNYTSDTEDKLLLKEIDELKNKVNFMSPPFEDLYKQFKDRLDHFRDNRVGTFIDVYFNPEHDLASEVVDQIQDAKKSLDICIYNLTEHRIYSELLLAVERGVKVRILTDVHNIQYLVKGNCNNKRLEKSKCHKLQEKGATVHVENVTDNGKPDHYWHMHNKFAIIDKKTVISGSYNWTKNASSSDENIIISDSPALAIEFSNKFEKLFSKYPSFAPKEHLTAELMSKGNRKSISYYEDLLSKKAA